MTTRLASADKQPTGPRSALLELVRALARADARLAG